MLDASIALYRRDAPHARWYAPG